MRYAYIIVGVIILLILVGVAFAFLRNNAGVATNGAPYQASLTGTAYNPAGYNTVPANTNCVSPCQPTQQVAYSYPVVYPVRTTATTVCPPTYNTTAASMWYTSPAYNSIVPGSYSYYYNVPGTVNTSVIPGGVNQVYPGSSYSYQYQVPGYAGGSYYPQQQQYQYQYMQGGTQTGGWYK